MYATGFPSALMVPPLAVVTVTVLLAVMMLIPSHTFCWTVLQDSSQEGRACYFRPTESIHRLFVSIYLSSLLSRVCHFLCRLCLLYCI